MRKLCIIFLVLVTCHSVYGQSQMTKITGRYFRSDPFNQPFSAFLKHLINDPTLTANRLKKRTDSTLFYFHGIYTKHNPFFFKPKRVEILLTEGIIPMNDSLPSDTVFIYQLQAFNDDTNEGIEELKKEFDKIYKRHKAAFYKTTLVENPVADMEGSTYNFFDPLHALAPFALTWYGPNKNGEMCLVLTVRMSNRNNMAQLPVPFYAL